MKHLFSEGRFRLIASAALIVGPAACDSKPSGDQSAGISPKVMADAVCAVVKNSPRNDFKEGDVMGGVVVRIPLRSRIAK